MGQVCNEAKCGFCFYSRHQFEDQIVPLKPALVDKSETPATTPEAHCMFLLLPYLRPPGTPCCTTSRTAWHHQQNMFFLHVGHFYSFVPSCTVDLLQSDWWKRANVLTYSKGEAFDKGTFFSGLPKCWGHEDDGKLDRIVVYSVIRTFAKCWDLFLIFKRTKWDTSTWPFFSPNWLVIGIWNLQNVILMQLYRCHIYRNYIMWYIFDIYRYVYT